MQEETKKQVEGGIRDPHFRIKTLDELKQSHNMYDGMITYFKEGDTATPKPLKTLDELKSVHKKATIYYGRSGEKYGEDAVLTEEARKEIRVDQNGVAPEEEDEETLVLEPVPSMEETVAPVMTESTAVDGLSEDELRIMESIMGTLPPEEEKIVTPKKPEVVVQPKVESFSNRKPESEKTVLTRMDLARIEQEKKEQERKDAITDPVLKAKEEGEPVILAEKEQLTAQGVLKEFITYAACFLAAIVFAILIVTFVGQKSEVTGSSMNDTLYNGEQVIVDKLSYRFHSPQRYDIVVFPESNKSNYVKRIIGLPGETISIREGYIYINDKLLTDDSYGKEGISTQNYGRLKQPVTLKDDEYFVLGDNRNNSQDSRSEAVGNVTKDRLIGKVTFRFWPFKAIGKVE
ncbi:MAG: signal peptidase I [Lachnospiraceae bacterium]|nr:signal peptidase I [Lachnospiraceae bacterium]